MKFKIWNKNLEAYVSDDEWFINGREEIFYFDKMDEELILCKHCVIVEWESEDEYKGADYD